MDNTYKNIKEYNSNKKSKILIVFDDMIADILSNRKSIQIVFELFIRGGKLNTSFVFITKSYFSVPKNIRLNSTHFFVMKIPKNESFNITRHKPDINESFNAMWRRGVVVIGTGQLHLTKPELRFCAASTPAPSVSEIRDDENLWQWS